MSGGRVLASESMRGSRVTSLALEPWVFTALAVLDADCLGDSAQTEQAHMSWVRMPPCIRVGLAKRQY